jgi:hypothetical protein
MPHYIEDLGTRRSFTVRKKTERPVVSFCGWTGTNSLVSGVKVWLKNTYYTMLSLLPGNGHMVIRKKGIWWRSRAILRLKQDAHVDTRFIERKSFSGSTKTISLDPVQAREEYIENMYDTDFALAPKGDPNISLRFYEALSMGRVPILIDTQVMLPAEDMLDYDSFVLRVPYQDIDRIAAIVVAFYENLTDESFAAMQRAARKAFTTYLRYDTYFNYLFTSAELQRAAKAVIR